MSKTDDAPAEAGAATGTELEPWDLPEGAIPPAMIEPTPELVQQAYDAVINNTLPPEIGDPSVTARAIQERIRRGSLGDSLHGLDKLPSWGDTLEDEPVTVLGFHLNPSSFENEDGSRGVYAVAELVVVATGEQVTVNAGGGNVLTQLVKAWEERAFPFRCVLKSKPTGTPGRSVHWLSAIES